MTLSLISGNPLTKTVTVGDLIIAVYIAALVFVVTRSLIRHCYQAGYDDGFGSGYAHGAVAHAVREANHSTT
jgi:hypothetical protein